MNYRTSFGLVAAVHPNKTGETAKIGAVPRKRVQ